MNELQLAINTVSRFLALRSLKKLTKDNLRKAYGIDKVDVLAVFGNDLPYIPEVACHSFHAGLCDYLIMCGGIGHSTEILKRKMRRIPFYANCDLRGAESDLFAEIATKVHHIPADQILVENQSTNCSENGLFAIRVLKERGIAHRTILLMQDPLMQYRSYVSMKRHLPKEATLISYAPFIPELNCNLDFDGTIENLWSKERFYELLVGEIWRLRDDVNGYGPRGKNYFDHLDIPSDVEKSYEILTALLKDHMGRCK